MVELKFLLLSNMRYSNHDYINTAQCVTKFSYKKVFDKKFPKNFLLLVIKVSLQIEKFLYSYHHCCAHILQKTRMQKAKMLCE